MRLRIVPLLAVAALLVAAPPALAGQFSHDLARVNAHLRIAIEYAPAELDESLGGAELVCRLGDRATAEERLDVAAADWTTLGQIVDEVATQDSRRIDVAFANADSVLGDLRQRYERRWAASPTDLRELRRGVLATRRGIASMRSAIAALEAPFDRWRAHECKPATLAAAEALTPLAPALERINVGMLRLWRLTQPPPTTARG
jgi:hypothetical protein